MLQPVLLTGASSGIGLVTSLHLARQGFKVVATMRNPANAEELRKTAKDENLPIEILPLDVTQPDSIRSTVAQVAAKYGGIGALVSNAGIQIRGYFEDLEDAQIRSVFETNLFGTMALVREVMPHMRQAGKGRIVLVSSAGGRIGSQGLSAYCSSKFALEGFGDCLALEAQFFGIQVSLVEPGLINTEIWGKNRGVATGMQKGDSPYAALFDESEKLAEWALRTSPIRSEHVATAILHALTAKRPRLRYIIGWRPRVLIAAKRIAPGELFDRWYLSFVAWRMRKALASR